jgi:hypothetical protein
MLPNSIHTIKSLLDDEYMYMNGRGGGNDVESERISDSSPGSVGFQRDVKFQIATRF